MFVSVVDLGMSVYQRHAKKLNHFHLSCLRKLLKIRWQDKIPDTEVLKKANMQSVHTLLKLYAFVFMFVLFNHHRREHILEKLSRKCLFAVVDLGMSTQPGV